MFATDGHTRQLRAGLASDEGPGAVEGRVLCVQGSGRLMDRGFQPSSRTGLTEAITRGAADYLDGKTDKDMRCSGIVRLLQNASAILRGHDG